MALVFEKFPHTSMFSVDNIATTILVEYLLSAAVKVAEVKKVQFGFSLSVMSSFEYGTYTFCEPIRSAPFCAADRR